jgi:hypothetical protein
LVVLLPIGALLGFGGQTLKDFAFALFIGVTSGAYSSIFIAAPVLALLKEREPRYMEIRRRAAARAARPGLRTAPVRGGLATTEPNGEVEQAPRVTATPSPGGAPGSGTRPRAGTGGTGGTGAKKKKSKPQGKPKRRRR